MKKVGISRIAWIEPATIVVFIMALSCPGKRTTGAGMSVILQFREKSRKRLGDIFYKIAMQGE